MSAGEGSGESERPIRVASRIQPEQRDTDRFVRSYRMQLSFGLDGGEPAPSGATAEIEQPDADAAPASNARKPEHTGLRSRLRRLFTVLQRPW